MTHITNKDPIFSCTYNIRMSFQVLWKNTLMLSVGILGHAKLQETSEMCTVHGKELTVSARFTKNPLFHNIRMNRVLENKEHLSIS